MIDSQIDMFIACILIAIFFVAKFRNITVLNLIIMLFIPILGITTINSDISTTWFVLFCITVIEIQNIYCMLNLQGVKSK